MKIAIFGAGSIGCLVGGSLLADGSDVVFIGKERVAGEIEKHGHVWWKIRTQANQDEQSRSGDMKASR